MDIEQTCQVALDLLLLLLDRILFAVAADVIINPVVPTLTRTVRSTSSMTLVERRSFSSIFQ